MPKDLPVLNDLDGVPPKPLACKGKVSIWSYLRLFC